VVTVKNIGLHYIFRSNVGPHPQNAKFSNVLLRRHISEVRLNLVICISLGLLYIFVVSLCHPLTPLLKLCCQTVVCLSCLSVTFMHCGQTVGRIKMKLGLPIGLGPGHIVLDGDPPPPPQRGTAHQFSAHICCGQMAAWIKMSLGMELGLGPGDCVTWGPRSPPQKAGGAPKFSARVYCGQTAEWMKLVHGMEVGLSPGDFVLDGDPAPFPKRGRSPLPTFGPFLLWRNGWMHQHATWYECSPQPRGLCVRWRPSPPPQKGG